MENNIAERKKTFADFSPFYILDETLRSLTVMSMGGLTMKGSTPIMELYDILRNQREIHLYDGEFRSVLDKLKDAKYIDEKIQITDHPKKQITEYKLTFDGLCFIIDGGYEQIQRDIELNRSLQEAQKKSLDDERLFLRGHSLNTLRWTRIAAIVAGLYLMWEIWKVYCQNVPWLDCYNLCPK